MTQVASKLNGIRRIFVTVGTQCPFPRLLASVDRWALQNPEVLVRAQSADTNAQFNAIKAVPFLQPNDYKLEVENADVLIGHAGMGTILSAVQHQKPVVIVPRLARLGEHRNDHQLGTVDRFADMPGIWVAKDPHNLSETIGLLSSNADDNRVCLGPPTRLAQRVMSECSAGSNQRPRVLAVASGGGHWVQLCRILSAMKSCEVACATTELGDDSLAPFGDVRRIRDGNRWSKVALLRSAVDAFHLVLSERPDAVLTTGAAPGYFAILAARLLNARTIWVDSIANSRELSMAGRKAGRVAHAWLTQWPELAKAGGPEFSGSIMECSAQERSEQIKRIDDSSTGKNRYAGDGWPAGSAPGPTP